MTLEQVFEAVFGNTDQRLHLPLNLDFYCWPAIIGVTQSHVTHAMKVLLEQHSEQTVLGLGVNTRTATVGVIPAHSDFKLVGV